MRTFCNKYRVGDLNLELAGSPRGSREDFQGDLDGSEFMYSYFLISYTKGKYVPIENSA